MYEEAKRQWQPTEQETQERINKSTDWKSYYLRNVVDIAATCGIAYACYHKWFKR